MFSGTSPCKLRTLQVLIRHTCTSRNQKFMIRIIADMIQQLNFLETIYLSFGRGGGGGGGLRDTVLASSEFTALAASLTSFVARPQLRTLDICRFPAPADVVADILCGFLVSPCSHRQTLKLPRLTAQPSSRQLLPATPCPVGAMPVPDAGVEYKELYLHASKTICPLFA